MTAIDCVTKTRSLVLGRRLYMRSHRWRDIDWYRAWPYIAAEWELVAAGMSK